MSRCCQQGRPSLLGLFVIACHIIAIVVVVSLRWLYRGYLDGSHTLAVVATRRESSVYCWRLIFPVVVVVLYIPPRLNRLDR